MHPPPKEEGSARAFTEQDSPSGAGIHRLIIIQPFLLRAFTWPRRRGAGGRRRWVAVPARLLRSLALGLFGRVRWGRVTHGYRSTGLLGRMHLTQRVFVLLFYPRPFAGWRWWGLSLRGLGLGLRCGLRGCLGRFLSSLSPAQPLAASCFAGRALVLRRLSAFS